MWHSVPGVRFEKSGLVTLKGVASPMRLFPRDAVIVGHPVATAGPRRDTRRVSS